LFEENKMEGINWASKRLRKTSLHPRKDHAGQFTSKPVIPNQSYLEIPRSDEDNLGGVGKLIQRLQIHIS
jgi:hypothetical protein